MIVTGIEEVTKSRSKIFLDGEFAFVLYKGELRRFHLAPGEEMKEKDYRQVMEEILPKRAKLRAMNLLLKKDYTTAQLCDKLRRGGYPEEIVQQALAYVASFRYTDDLRYCMDYITCHQETKSKMRMEQDLRAKGIPKDILEKAWEAWEQAGGEQDELQMIGELLAKRHYDPETATQAEQRREYAFLMRKGFPTEKIKQAVFGRFDIWTDE